MGNKTKAIFFSGLVLSLFIFGTIGYKFILDIAWLDALYMTTITISTVGYGEVEVMNEFAKVYSIILILFSMAVIGYGVSTIVRFIFEGNLKELLRIRRMKERIERMKDHYVVCGAGKTGIYVIQSLQKKSIPFVVIDHDREVVDRLKEEDISIISADATTEMALKKANIIQAKGLITTLSSDADNLFTVLTARDLNPYFTIISKVINQNSHEKLLRAGANKTVSPNEIGGHRMASMLLRPTVISFLDTVTHAGDLDLDLDEIAIDPHSHLCHLTLKDTQIKEKTDLMVIAIKRGESDEMIFNPSETEILQPHDILIVLGKDQHVRNFNRLTK